LILRKIIKIWATRCHILRLKCIKFVFGWGSAPDPAGEAYSAPPGLQLDFRGPICKAREARGTIKRKGGKEREKEIEGKKNLSPLKFKSGYDTVH